MPPGCRSRPLTTSRRALSPARRFQAVEIQASALPFASFGSAALGKHLRHERPLG
jgi:hypothetical protein